MPVKVHVKSECECVRVCESYFKVAQEGSADGSGGPDGSGGVAALCPPATTQLATGKDIRTHKGQSCL